MRITMQTLRDNPDLPLHLVENGADTGQLVFSLKDGEVTLPAREGILHMLFWYPLIVAGLEVHRDDVRDVSHFKASTITAFHTAMYNRLLDDENLTKTDRLELIWQSINRMYNFICQYLGVYHQTIDAMGLDDIRSHPDAKMLYQLEADPNLGILYAEDEIKRKNEQLVKLLSDPNGLPNNQLLPFMQSNNIKLAQFPQIFIAYGARADIDSSIKQHFIRESTISGLSSNEDFGVELLAAKKAQHASKTSIQDSQSMGRKLRILCSPLHTIHRGWCGNKITIPYKISKENHRGLIYNAIVLGSERVYVTPKMSKELIGQTVALVSPITCRHTDGFCEGCAGWGNDRLYDYFPDAIAGTHVITWLVELISQAILSTKHRARTSISENALPVAAKKYFALHRGEIFLNKRYIKMQKLLLRVPIENMRPLTDLQEDYSETVASFSELSTIAIVAEDKETIIDEFDLSSEYTIPYMSAETLNIIEDGGIDETRVSSDQDYLYVPLAALPEPEDGPVFRIITISADMEAFAAKLKTMIETKKNGICNHTTVAGALAYLTKHVYAQSDLVLFPMQVLIRSLLLDPTGAPGIPQITDINNVQFGTLEQVTTRRSVTMKLITDKFKAWINNPETYIAKRGESVYDQLFGFNIHS